MVNAPILAKKKKPCVLFKGSGKKKNGSSGFASELLDKMPCPWQASYYANQATKSSESS